MINHVQLVGAPRAVVFQAPLSMEFFRQEYWCGSPFPSLVDLPNPGIKPEYPALQAYFLLPESPGKPNKSLAKHEARNTH